MNTTHTSNLKLNRAQLRIIAMLTMLIDHTGLHLLGNDFICRTIGRIAFPVYAFLLADGFMHFKDDAKRVKRRFLIMLALTAVSEIAYDFAKYGLDYTAYTGKQSVLISLTFGFAGMYITDRIIPNDPERRPGFIRILAVTAIAAFLCVAAYLLKADYGFAGPFFVLAFYWYIRLFGQNESNTGKRILFLCGIIACYLAYRCGMSMDKSLWKSSHIGLLAFYTGYMYVPFILTSYNWERGRHTRMFNAVYTAFYPAHLFILGLLKLWL